MKKHSTDLKQASALLKQMILEYPGAQVIADYGAGTGDKTMKLASEHNKVLYRYDPYLPPEVNREFWKACQQDIIDVVTCSNVLNVIMDQDELHTAMQELLRASKRSKIGAVITVYQAPMPSRTQRGKPLSWYAELFSNMTTRTVDIHHGKIWISPETEES